MHPIVKVTIDGKPVAGAFYERLISIQVTDKEGITSDTVQIELHDGPPAFLALPRAGATIDVLLGYRETGVRSLGTFTVDKVSGKCLPYSLSISGKAANLSKGKLKEQQERHWDGKSLKDIVGQIASESGLTAAVDGEIGAHVYKWLAQQDESGIHFLERLARRHNALFSIKGGRLIFAARGSGNSASGSFVGSVIVTPPIILQGTCNFEANDRTKYKKVVAYYEDKDQAKRIEVEAEADGEADSVFRIPEPLADAAEADKAAKSKAKQLKRGEGSASVTVVGDTGIAAGAPLLFQGVRPGLDGVPYVIDTATHTYSKGEGYRTQISAKLYDGKSAKAKKDGAAQSKAGTSSKDTTAPNSPAGTPATPSSWSQSQRNGGSTGFGSRSSGTTDGN